MIEDNNKMRCLAAIDIKKGEKLAITYVELIMPGVLRRKLLKKVRKIVKNSTLWKLREFNLTIL